MKKNHLFLIFMAVAFLPACDKLEDATDVDFTTSVSTDLNVSITEPDETYNGTEVISLANDDTNDYLDKIKNVEITKLTYTVISFAGDEAGTVSGTLKADGVTLHTVSNQNVSNAYYSLQVFEVTDPNLIKNAAQALLNNHQLTLQASGTAVYSTSMFFTIHVKMDLKIKANTI